MKTYLTKNNNLIQVDDCDEDLLRSGSWELKTGIVSRNIKEKGKDKKLSLARLITGCPNGLVVDHVDRNPCNNQRSNLRICTQKQNTMNKCQKGNRRFKGLKKRKYSYEAWITVDGKEIYLCAFKDPRDSAFMYNLAAVHYQGKYAYINDISWSNSDENN